MLNELIRQKEELYEQYEDYLEELVHLSNLGKKKKVNTTHMILRQIQDRILNIDIALKIEETKEKSK